MAWMPRIGSGVGGGGVLAGDATGPIGANTVVGLQGNPVSANPPALGEILVWNGAVWTPGVVPPSPNVGGTFTFSAPVAVGDVVYKTAVAGEVARADNGSIATSPAIGVVVAIPGAGVATVIFIGEVAIAGLVAGSVYWLGATGALVTPGPIGPAGTVVQILGIAKDPGTLILAPKVHTVL